MTTVLQQNVNMVIQLLHCSICCGQDDCFLGLRYTSYGRSKEFSDYEPRAIFKSYLEVWD